MGNYIILSKNQALWTKKKILGMFQFIRNYGEFQSPITDQEWEIITKKFREDSKLSRNNGIIINCAIGFLEYLEKNNLDVLNHRPCSCKLNDTQNEFIPEFMDNVFALACEKKYPLEKVEFESVIDSLGAYQELLSEHMLFQSIIHTFSEYVKFCQSTSMEKNLILTHTKAR